MLNFYTLSCFKSYRMLHFCLKNLLQAYSSVFCLCLRLWWSVSLEIKIFMCVCLMNSHCPHAPKHIQILHRIWWLQLRSGFSYKGGKMSECVHSEVTLFLRQFKCLSFTALETVLTIKLTCWYIFFLVKAFFYEAMSCSHMLLRCHNISQSSTYSANDNRYSETSQLGQNFSSCLQKWLCE